MLSSAASILIRLVGWSYLPAFATRQLLAAYHRFLFSRGITAPQAGSLRWQLHYRAVYAVVILAYLSYNLIDAASSTPSNFFQILGVTPDADDVALKNAYRAFAKRYHPDRAGSASEHMFIAIRDAYEALKDPVKRFAYERFGPDALSWRDCSIPRDFLVRGLTQSSGFYIGTGAILIIMSAIKKPSPVAFWRYMLLFVLLASELCLVTGYNSSGILGLIFPDRVAFQHVLFLHHLFVFLSVALSQVVPVLFPKISAIRPEDPRTFAPLLERLNDLARRADGEVSHLLHQELRVMSNDASLDSTSASVSASLFDAVKPCSPSSSVLSALVLEMENMLVEQQIRSEPPLRALWDSAVQREREGEKEEECSSLQNAGSVSNEGGDTPQASNIIISTCLPSPPSSASPETRLMELSIRCPSPALPSSRPMLRNSISRSYIRIVEK